MSRKSKQMRNKIRTRKLQKYRMEILLNRIDETPQLLTHEQSIRGSAHPVNKIGKLHPFSRRVSVSCYNCCVHQLLIIYFKFHSITNFYLTHLGCWVCKVAWTRYGGYVITNNLISKYAYYYLLAIFIIDKTCACRSIVAAACVLIRKKLAE